MKQRISTIVLLLFCGALARADDASQSSPAKEPELRLELLRRVKADQEARTALISWLTEHGKGGAVSPTALSAEHQAEFEKLAGAVKQADQENTENVARALGSQQSRWQATQTGVLSSTSLLNLAYLAFVLRDKYALDFSPVRRPCFWEAGVLRDCLVHHGGVVPNEAFRAGLTACIAEVRAIDSVGTHLGVTEKVMWVFVEETRTSLSVCDY